MPEQTVRFAVGTREGPCSTIFRCWVPPGKSDIYIAARPVAHSMKISLHESGKWRTAFTREFANSGSPLVPSPGDRLPTEWMRPPEFEPGWTSAFLILVPHSQLGPAPLPGGVVGDIQWIADPGSGMNTRFYFLIAAPGVEPPNAWPGKETMASRLIKQFSLANGETLWIVVQDTAVEGNNERFLENYKKVILESASLPADVFETPGVRPPYPGAVR